MWSTRFLWAGILSAIPVAALTLAGMFLVLFVAFGGKNPSYTLAKMVIFASPGLIVYPASWYMIIFRQRNYSLNQTMMLVAVAFGIVGLIIALSTLIGGLVSLIYLPAWKIHPFFIIAAPIGFAIWFVIGTVILAVPYAVVAPPIALLHRFLLTRCFMPTGSVILNDETPPRTPRA